MGAAERIEEQAEDRGLRIAPSAVREVKGDPREVAVAMFRDLADRLERRELEGARIQWRDGLIEIETVELDRVARQVRFGHTIVTDE